MGEGDIGEGLRLEEEFIAVSNTPWAEGPANFLETRFQGDVHIYIYMYKYIYIILGRSK